MPRTIENEFLASLDRFNPHFLSTPAKLHASNRIAINVQWAIGSLFNRHRFYSSSFGSTQYNRAIPTLRWRRWILRWQSLSCASCAYQRESECRCQSSNVNHIEVPLKSSKSRVASLHSVSSTNPFKILLRQHSVTVRIQLVETITMLLRHL